MYQLPLHSVDSSSWIQGAQVYGLIRYWDNGIRSCSSRNYFTGKKKVSPKLAEILERIKVTPKQFMNKDNHRGKTSIGTLISILAYYDYQKLSKIKNQNLFLATANRGQLLQLVYVNDQISKGTLSWENFNKS
jgi:hypothetical protein